MTATNDFTDQQIEIARAELQLAGIIKGTGPVGNRVETLNAIHDGVVNQKAEWPNDPEAKKEILAELVENTCNHVLLCEDSAEIVRGVFTQDVRQ